MTTEGQQGEVEDQANVGDQDPIEGQQPAGQADDVDDGDEETPDVTDEESQGDEDDQEPAAPAADGEGPPAHHDRGSVEDPDDVPDPDLDDPDGEETRFPIAPWLVNLLILLAVLVFIAVNIAAWRWVVGTSEANEKGDWAQLRSIKGSLTGFATFLLGGFLGFTAQKGATERAKGKARKNREAATHQNKVAKRNRDKARTNKNVAQDRGQRLRVIHGKTLTTLKQTQPTQARRGRLITGADAVDLIEGETVNLMGVDGGRFVVESTDDGLRQQLLEIAELAGEDW